MKAPRNWKRLTRHPLSAEYPNLAGRAWDQYVANLRRFGVVGRRRIVLHEGMVLDGWQLQRACVEANVKPLYERLELVGEMTPAEYVTTANDLRRHETQDQAIKRAQERRDRVAAARCEGQSLREIGKAEGVCESQVRRDLAAATAPGGAVAPQNGQVTGRDGKTRPATRARPETETESATEVPPIPERLQPIFKDNALFKRLAREADRLADEFQVLECTEGYLRAGNAKPRREYSAYFRAAAQAIAAITPIRPCPECGGELEPSMDNDSCKTCLDRGYQTAEEVAS